MFIQDLSVFNFRNIEQVRITFPQPITLIHGPNGSGKTSLIEAIHFLSSCRSFRPVTPASLIRTGSTGFTLQASVRERSGGLTAVTRLGVQRLRSDETRIAVNGHRSDRVSELADRICVQLVHPRSSDIFTEPELRRRYVDWGTYYMSADFRVFYADYKKCIRQRNALLKNHAPDGEIAAWSEQLAGLSDQISRRRAAYMQRLEPHLRAALEVFLPGVRIDAEFYPGHPEHEALIDLLTRNLERDRQAGFTFHGCHRADLRIRVMGSPAGAVLSRGQMKLLACAMRMAQGRLLHDSTGRSCIFMFDDLGSELDVNSQHLILERIAGLDAQVLITSISSDMRLPAAYHSVEIHAGAVTAP